MIKEESDDDIFQESQIDEEEGNKNLQYQPNIKKEDFYVTFSMFCGVTLYLLKSTSQLTFPTRQLAIAEVM